MTTASVLKAGRIAATGWVMGAVMGIAHAQTPAHDAASIAAAAPATSADTAWSQGQVVRWDPRTRKITLKHGPITSLEMPPMTMVFKVEDSVSDTSALQPGATVRFVAAQIKGAYVVTQVAAPTTP
jgi:Cu/Ag efflux protein CusF